MEGQYVPPVGEPQKVRNRTPRTQNPNLDANQGAQGSIRKRRDAPQSEVANWAYNEGDEYGYADPALCYPEHYGYGTDEHVDPYGYGIGEHVDAHGYGTGEHVDAHGYGTGEHVDAHGYGTGKHVDAHGYGTGEHVDAHGYGYDGAHAAAGQGHGCGYDYGYGEAALGYGHGQDYGSGGAQADAGRYYGYVAPTQEVEGKAKKSLNPRPVADGGERRGAGYEKDGDGYGQPGQGGYADGYAYPEAYNAVVPEQQPSRNLPKRESKRRKPTRTKPMENGNQDDGGSTLASGAVTGDPDGMGNKRSSGSNRSKADRSDRTMNADATGGRHHRASNRLEQEGATPRLNAIARDHRDGGNGRVNPERHKQKLETEGGGAKAVKSEANALNVHVRNTSGGKPKQTTFQHASMVVFDPHDQTTLVTGMPEPAPAPSSLDTWMKVQGDKAGPKIQQDESLIVYGDHDQSELETRLFGVPLAEKQSINLPPVEDQWDTPQYQQPRENYHYQVPDKPLYQPVRHRRPCANPPLPRAYHDVQPVEAGDIQEYHAEGSKQMLPVAEPNAKCMACVHGVGVPVARLVTRIACRQCATYCCTIL